MYDEEKGDLLGFVIHFFTISATFTSSQINKGELAKGTSQWILHDQLQYGMGTGGFLIGPRDPRSPLCNALIDLSDKLF